MRKRRIDEINLAGKNVLVRVDFNVPLNSDYRMTDDFRIVSSLPTIRKIIETGGRAILMSHLKRPGGHFDQRFSLQQIAIHLSTLLGRKVKFAENCMVADNAVASLKDGDVLLLENLRFYEFESAKDHAQRNHMAKRLAKYGDIFINEAFGTSHRPAASMVELPNLMSEKAVGYLVAREIEILSKVLTQPDYPFVLILGGKKASDKIGVIKRLMMSAETILIGGAMSYPFLKAQGYEIGQSFCEGRVSSADWNDAEMDYIASSLLETSREMKSEIITPVDHYAVTSGKGDSLIQYVNSPNIPEGLSGCDIGPKTEELFRSKIAAARMIVWNGPMGKFEDSGCEHGTKFVADLLATCSAFTIVGGGETAQAVRDFGFFEMMSHVSTGGGACLEFLEGKDLPGIISIPSV